MPKINKPADNRPTITTNRLKPSGDLNVGSKKWHFAVADEIDAEASFEKDKNQASCLKERAAFHRLIGENQK
ncbi:MAG: hypothetical protein M0R32_02405 [Candidatus Cloacimonetes bacterium]|jgi:hypothetical protein|nr:hypothetical protein [Candidatus Cloacimonadota bacterium]